MCIMLNARDAARFWSKVDKNGPTLSGMDTPCWVWLGKPNQHGYGRLHVGGREGTRWMAHRLSFTIANGAIPEGLEVCHRCDNPICVNPDHHFLGTQRENIEDAQKKGRVAAGARHGMSTRPDRRPIGERHAGAILTAETVLEMRRLYRTGAYTYADLGQRFGIHRVTARDAVVGRRWKHLPL
jgi:hypothetical protein